MECPVYHILIFKVCHQERQDGNDVHGMKLHIDQGQGDLNPMEVNTERINQNKNTVKMGLEHL